MVIAAFFWYESHDTFLIIACVFGLATFILGIVGIVNAAKLNKTAYTILFVILFILTTFFGAIALGVSLLLLYMTIF